MLLEKVAWVEEVWDGGAFHLPLEATIGLFLATDEEEI